MPRPHASDSLRTAYSRLAELLRMRFPTHLFQRVVSGGNILRELDGLRAVAILAVVVFHSSGYIYVKGLESGAYAVADNEKHLHSLLGWTLSHGFLGVQLFFAISGFVVTLPFARAAMGLARRPSLRSYFLRRVTRIEPPYLIALAIYALAAVVMFSDGLKPAPYVAAIFYLKNALYHEYSWPFFVSWSLEVEVQFYLLAPLFSALYLIRSAAWRRLLLCAAIALSGMYAANVRLEGTEPAPYFGPLQHGWGLGPELVFFLVGMLAADFWLQPLRSGTASLPRWCWDVLWIAGISACTMSYAVLPSTRWGLALLVVGLFLMCLGTFWSSLVRAILQRPIIAAIGCACYTIYLFHSLVLLVVGRFLTGLISGDYARDMLILAIPFALGITLITLVGFPLIERPFMFRDWPAMLRDAVKRRSLWPLYPLFAPPSGTNDAPRAV